MYQTRTVPLCYLSVCLCVMTPLQAGLCPCLGPLREPRSRPHPSPKSAGCRGPFGAWLQSSVLLPLSMVKGLCQWACITLVYSIPTSTGTSGSAPLPPISPAGSASFLLCLLSSSHPSCKGTSTLVPWPQGCLPAGPFICGLSSVRDCSHLVTGSPSLPDKYRHAREMMLLLPTHRDRPSSAMYPAAILENGQVVDTDS